MKQIQFFIVSMENINYYLLQQELQGQTKQNKK